MTIAIFWSDIGQEIKLLDSVANMKMSSTSLWPFSNRKSLKLGCPFKLLQKVKPDWQLAADLTDFMFMNPPSLMNIYMGVAKWRYLKIIVFSNTKKRALKGMVQSISGPDGYIHVGTILKDSRTIHVMLSNHSKLHGVFQNCINVHMSKTGYF